MARLAPKRIVVTVFAGVVVAVLVYRQQRLARSSRQLSAPTDADR
jgi:hypothetical protein